MQLNTVHKAHGSQQPNRSAMTRRVDLKTNRNLSRQVRISKRIQPSSCGDQSFLSGCLKTKHQSDPNRKLIEETDVVPHKVHSSESQNTLQLCPLCNRFYGTISIGIHRKYCQISYESNMKKRAAQQAWEEKQFMRPKHPPGMLCYICGRRYTNASMHLHLPRCLRQWREWNRLLPKKLIRTQDPVRPDPTNEELIRRVEEAHANGKPYYSKEDALDDIMYEASLLNSLPLEFIF